MRIRLIPLIASIVVVVGAPPAKPGENQYPAQNNQ